MPRARRQVRQPDDNEPLSDWERNFLASIDAWEGELTPAAGEARRDRTGS